MSEQSTSCRESIELRCAGCGEVVSCDGPSHSHDHLSIVTELMAENRLGFGDLLSALMIASWDVRIQPGVLRGNPRVVLIGTPVTKHGYPRLDKHDVIAIWERPPGGWEAGKTGHQPIGGGPFTPATAAELTKLVSASPASWVRTAR